MPELSRRKFIQLTVIGSAGIVGGCAPRHEETTGQYGGMQSKIEPYVEQPPGLIDGVPQYFATTCGMCAAGCGLLVRTIGGRAHKVEGIPGYPVNDGRTCARGQGSLQHAYNPDRLRYAMLNANTSTPIRTDWASAMSAVASRLTAANGRTAILTDAVTIGTSPQAMASVAALSKLADATITNYALLDDAPWRHAVRAVHGRDQLPDYLFDEADVIVSFGGNFLDSWPSPVLASRRFGDFRHGPRRTSGHGYFAYIGPRMSMTAAKADDWLPCNPGTEASVARAVLAALQNEAASDDLAQTGTSQVAVDALADRIRAARTRAVAVGGDGLLSGTDSSAAFLAVEQINAATKSQCVGFGESPTNPVTGGQLPLRELISHMSSGTIDCLIVAGQANPLFTLPTATGFADALKRVPFIVSIAPHSDETVAAANVVLPMRSFLEETIDTVPHVIPANTRIIDYRQPVIDPRYIFAPPLPGTPPQPWFDTRSFTEIVDDLTTRLGGKAAPFTTSSDDALSHGYISTTATKVATITTGESGHAANTAAQPSAASNRPLTLLLYPHIYWLDGRHANLPFFQEIPDPMTSAVWNSWVEINMEAAHAKDIRTGDIVRITSDHGSIEVAAVPSPAIHPDAVAMPIGQGHVSGAAGETAKRGVNPLAIADPTFDAATGAFLYGATKVTIEKVRSAKAGYHPEDGTLVIVQDLPGGAEPVAVKNLIHQTAREFAAAKGT